MSTAPTEIPLLRLDRDNYLANRSTVSNPKLQVDRLFFSRIAALVLIVFNGLAVYETVQSLAGRKIDSSNASGVAFLNVLALADVIARRCSEHSIEGQRSFYERVETLFNRSMKWLLLTLLATSAISGKVDSNEESFHQYTWITAAMLPPLFLLTEQHPIKGLPRNALLTMSAVAGALLINHNFGNLDLDYPSNYSYLHAIIYPLIVLNPLLLIFPDVRCKRTRLTRNQAEEPLPI